MKSNRNITIALGLIIGAVVGGFIGTLLDQAINAQLDPAHMGAFSACPYCPGAVFSVVGDLLKVNAGAAMGLLVGLGVGGVVGWALAGSRSGGDEELERDRVSTRSRASDDTLIASPTIATTEIIVPPAPARTDEALTRRLEQLSTLADASLHETFDAERILTRAHDEALKITSAQFASLIQLDWDQPQQAKAMRAGATIDFPQFAPIEEEVLATGQSRVVSDFQAEPVAPVVAGVRSALLVPLIVDEKVVGLIGLHSDKPNAFDFDLQKVVEALAAQTAVALSNAHRYEEQIKRGEVMRSRAEQLQQLLQLSRSLQPERPLAANLEAVAFSIQQNLGFNIVVVGVINPLTTQLELSAAAGLPAATFDKLKQTPFSWETYSAYLRHDFQTGSVYYIPRDQAVELYRPFDVFEIAKPAEIAGPDRWKPGDVVLVPIYGSTGEAIGLIQLDDPRDGHTPSRQITDALGLFTGPAALVIENARLLTQMRDRVNETNQRASQLESLNAAAHHISAALRREDVINVSLEQLRRVVGYDRVTLYLTDKANGQFRVAASRGLEGEAERLGMAAELLDRSIFTEVVANRRALLVPDVNQDARFPKSAGRKGSWLGIPLVGHGDVIGLLGLDKLEVAYYGQSFAPVGQAFANQMAVALENARLYDETLFRTDELTERTQRLALLHHASAEIVGALDADRALNVMVKELAQAFGADQTVALVWGEGDDAALTRSTTDRTERVSIASMGADILVRWVRDSLTPYIVDAEALAHLGFWAGEGIKSAVALPLAVRETLVGVVVIGSRDSQRQFSGTEIEIGQTVAKQAALMVSNAQQYYKGQQRVVELASITQVSRAVMGLLELKPLYEVIRSQVVGLTGAPSLALGLYDESRNEFIFPLAVQAGQLVQLQPRVPGNVSQFVIQSHVSLLLTGDFEASGRSLGISDLINRGGAWDAVEGLSYLAVPLLVGDKLIGVLQLAHPEQNNAFTASHERILMGAGSQFAAAIENARRHEQIQQASLDVHERVAQLRERATQLEALAQATQMLTGTLRLSDVYELIGNQVQKVVASDAVSVWVRDSADESFKVVGKQGGKSTVVINSPLANRLTESRSVVIIPDVSADKAWPKGSAGSWMGVALNHQGAILGFIGLDKTEAGYYTALQASLLQPFAAQAVQAIENARQFERSRARVQELDSRTRDLSLINHISDQLSSTLDLQILAELGARELAAALNSEVAGVALLDGETRLIARYPTEPRAVFVPESLLARLRGATTPLRLPDDTEAHLSWLGAGIQSALVLPLKVDGSLVGLAVVGQQSSALSYSDESVKLATVVAGYLAAAAQKALLYQRTQRQLIELGSITQVGRAVSGAIERHKLYDIVRERVLALTGAETLCLAVYDESRAEVSYPLVVQKGKVVEVESRTSTGIVAYVLRTRQSLLITGETADKRLGDEAVAALADKVGVIKGKSLLAVPLMVDERLVGVLAVADDRPGQGFTVEHERLLTNIASHIAVAVENARLFESSVARAQELDERTHVLAAVSGAAIKLKGLLDPESISRIAAKEFAVGLNTEKASVVLLNANAPTLVLYPEDTVESFNVVEHTGGLINRLRQKRLPLALSTKDEALAKLKQPTWLGPSIKSALVSPLFVGDDLIGLAVVASSLSRQFTDGDLELAKQLTAHVVAALETAGQYQASLQNGYTLNERAKRLDLLNHSAAELNSALNSERILARVSATLAQNLKAEKVYSLALADGPRQAVVWPQPNGGSLPETPREGDVVVEELRETLVPTTLTDVSRQAPWLGKDLNSALLLPLVASGRLIGLSALCSAAPRHFEPAEIELAAALTGPASVALNNARQHEKTLKRLVDLGSITQTSRAVGGAVELDQLYDTVRAQVGSLVGAASMSLALYDESRNEVTFPVLVRNGRKAESAARTPGAVLWHIIQTQQPLFFANDAETQARQQGFSLSENGSSNGVYGKSYLGVPLLSGNKTIGVLSVADAEKNGVFDTEHEHALTTLAVQVASAIDNARIYETAARRVQELEDRLQRLTLLNRAWTDLSHVMEAQPALTLGLQESVQALNADFGAALWWEDGAALGSAFPAAAASVVEQPASSDPLIQWLDSSQAPASVENLAEESLTKSANLSWLGEGARSALFVPLTVNGKVAGVFGLASKAARRFEPYELELASSLSQLVSTAVHNVAQYEKTQRRLNEAANVGTVSRALNRVTDLNGLWAALQTQVTALTGAETMALQLYDEASGEVAVPLLVQQGVQSQIDPQAPGALTRHVLLSQQSLLLNGDWKRKAKGLGLVVRGGGVSEPFTGQSYLGVPLLVGDRMTGVLALADERPDFFNESHVALLESVSTQIAMAVENARLFARTRGELAREQDRTEQARQTTQELAQQLQTATHEIANLRIQQAEFAREVGRLEILINLSQTLPQAADTDSALLQALTQTGEALGIEYAVLFVRDPQSGLFARRAVYDPEGAKPDVPQSLQPTAGLVGLAVKNGQALAVADLPLDKDWQAQPLVAGTAYLSGLVTPLMVGANGVGAAVYLSAAARDFAPAEATLTEAVAGQMAFVAQHGALATQQQQLETQKQQLFADQAALAEERAELESRSQALSHQSSELDSKDLALAAQLTELELKAESLATQSIALESKGRALADQSDELEAQQEALTALQRDLSDKQNALDRQLADQLTELESKSQTLASRSAELDSRDQLLAAQLAELDSKGQTLAAQSTELELQTQTLAAQSAELASQREALAALQRELAEKQNDLDRTLAEAATAATVASTVSIDRTVSEPAETTHVYAEDLVSTDSGPEIVTPPQYDSESTLIVPRKRVPEPLAEFDVTAADLLDVPDNEPVNNSQSLNLWLVGGLITIFILGGLALALAATGGLGRFLGGSEPTAVSVIVTNTAAPTALVTATPLVAPTSGATATVAPTLVPTETPLPTETATEVPTDTPAPTAGPTLPPGVIAYGTIQVAEGTSARLRASPNGDVVGSVPDNTQVQVLQGREVSAGVNWIQIRLNSGQVGWIAENLVETTSSP